MNTQSFKQSDIEESWIVVDAKEKTLGRLATKLAFRLRGKHKPEYSPNADLGDFIVVINAKDIHVTGKKMTQKMYYRHSGYPGGIKSKPLNEVLESSPEEVIKAAVKGCCRK
jgi:ribosomal protein L13, bacterial type